jgi:uncharacterized protein involved in exopolysaccharide biosynthesis
VTRILSRHRRHIALTALLSFLAGATLERWLDRP